MFRIIINKKKEYIVNFFILKLTKHIRNINVSILTKNTTVFKNIQNIKKFIKTLKITIKFFNIF